MNEFKKVESDMKLDKLKTELKKENFIKEIKNGLGDHIKVNGGKLKKIKRSFFKRTWEKVLKIF